MSSLRTPLHVCRWVNPHQYRMCRGREIAAVTGSAPLYRITNGAVPLTYEPGSNEDGDLWGPLCSARGYIRWGEDDYDVGERSGVEPRPRMGYLGRASGAFRSTR